MARVPERIGPAELRAAPLPDPGSSKYDRGDVLVLGGARSTPGAVLLAGEAALRVGAGRLTLALAGSAAPATAVAFPEAAVLALAETPDGAIVGREAGRVAANRACGALAIGAGLDDADEARSLLEEALPGLAPDTSVVLDAFALGALASAPTLADPVVGRVVLTPNAEEAARLLAVEDVDLPRDLPRIADRFGAVVTCYGVIAEPGGGVSRIGVEPGPGLGTSGSGDVLAGAIAGLLARGADPARAARWGTYLHAAAGEALAARIGPLGYLARELPGEFPGLLASIQSA